MSTKIDERDICSWCAKPLEFGETHKIEEKFNCKGTEPEEDRLARWDKVYDEIWPAEKVFCYKCRKKEARFGYTHCPSCQKILREAQQRVRDVAKQKREAIRLVAINKYGGKCIRCGCNETRLLEFHHVDKDGRWHRQSLKGNLLKWATNIYDPKKIALLCPNCHVGIHKGFMTL